MCRLEFANFIGDSTLTKLASEVASVKSYGELVSTLKKLNWRAFKLRRNVLSAVSPDGIKYKFWAPNGEFGADTPVRARRVD